MKPLNINSNNNVKVNTSNNFFVTIDKDPNSDFTHNIVNDKDYLQASVLNSFFLKSTNNEELVSFMIK